MSVEEKRGCGYRRAGGLYLVGGGPGEPCERLPIPCKKCPCCGRPPIEKTRGAQFVRAQYIFGMALPCVEGDAPAKTGHHARCIVCDENLLLKEGDPKDQFLVMWIGKEHYATPADWTAEANRLGVSRRLPAIPKGLVDGKTWVLVGHPEAIQEECGECHGTGGPAVGEKCMPCGGRGKRATPGLFHAFLARGIELIVTPSMKKQRWVKDMVKKRGVKLVDVPENDPDHAPETTKKSARKRAMDRHARKVAAKQEAGA